MQGYDDMFVRVPTVMENLQISGSMKVVFLKNSQGKVMEIVMLSLARKCSLSTQPI